MCIPDGSWVLEGVGLPRTGTAGTSRHVLLLQLPPLLDAKQACEPGCRRDGEQSALFVMPQAHSQDKHGWEDAGQQCIRQPASWAIELQGCGVCKIPSVPICPTCCMPTQSAMLHGSCSMLLLLGSSQFCPRGMPALSVGVAAAYGCWPAAEGSCQVPPHQKSLKAGPASGA